jgi:aminoglycoside phosphotransferase (APT) family kinase protein
VEVGGEVLAAVGAACGSDVRLRERTAWGESGTTFLIEARGAELLLKLAPDGPGVGTDHERVVRLVERMRERGYPAPGYVAVGRAAGVVFTVQEWLPGSAVEPDRLAEVVPQLLDAVELQRDAGDIGDPPWPEEVRRTIEAGGDGYCLHSTMRRDPDTAALLDRLQGIAGEGARGPVRRTDVVHFDLNPANVLHVAGRLTGIVDWSGASSGDRGFDVATLLFYGYDVEAVRSMLWERAVAISGRGWTTVYLCHLVLRQVEWIRRHRPGSPEDRRWVALGARVLDDCG